MQTLSLTLQIALPMAYAVCLWSYARLFFAEDESKPARVARLSLIAALSVHFGILLVRADLFKRCPLWTEGEALLFLALMLGAIHLFSEWLADTSRLGLFTLSPTALCALAALPFLGRELELNEQYRSSWFIFHIVASLASYAAYSLAAVLAGLYLMLHRKLKNKTFDMSFRKLPPLEKLDRLSAAWAFLGTVLMLASSAIGLYWVQNHGLGRMSPREIGIFAILAVFLFAAITRRTLGWRGKRHAQFILAGFLVLLLVNLAGLHGFQF